MRILRRIGLSGWLAVFVVISAGLCGSGCSTSSSTFQSQLLELLGDTAASVNPDTLTIRIVNEAGAGTTEELTLEIDGQTGPLTCSATEHVCDYTLPACPQQVIAISERRTDAQGNFVGGRNFSGSNESFNFSQGEYSCGQVILYRFTESVAEAFVF